MTKYVDVDAILKKLPNDLPYKASVKRVLMQAEGVEVKYGEWQIKARINRFMEEIDHDFYAECPFCHRVYYVPCEFEDEKMLGYARKNYPYCNCGAKMDGKDTNGPTK